MVEKEKQSSLSTVKTVGSGDVSVGRPSMM